MANRNPPARTTPVTSAPCPPRQPDPPSAITDRLPCYLGIARTLGHQDTCLICLSKFTSEERILRLPCFHEFHFDCISSWLLNSKLCPIDRTDLVAALKML